MQSFFISVFQATLTQVVGLLGTFFFLGFILSWLQNKTQQLYQQAIGWKGILWTAWFGTPFHELAHVFFAKFFRHKIHRIAIFEPNEETGGLGHVDHSYHPTSIYQQIGNFFIGAAPLLFGVLVLAAFVTYLAPNGDEVISPLLHSPTSFKTLFSALPEVFTQLFSQSNLSEPSFWLFLYASICVASHIAPSRQDRQGMWRGFAWVVLLLLIMNMITLLVGFDVTAYILSLNRYLGIVTAMFLFALIISLTHYAIAKLILGTIIFLRTRK